MELFVIFIVACVFKDVTYYPAKKPGIKLLCCQKCALLLL